MRHDDRVAYGFFLVCLALFALLILCSACAATPNAGVRRVAAHWLTTCRAGLVNAEQQRQCSTEVRAFCAKRGIEKTCGEGI